VESYCITNYIVLQNYSVFCGDVFASTSRLIYQALVKSYYVYSALKISIFWFAELL